MVAGLRLLGLDKEREGGVPSLLHTCILERPCVASPFALQVERL